MEAMEKRKEQENNSNCSYNTEQKILIGQTYRYVNNDFSYEKSLMFTQQSWIKHLKISFLDTK